MLNNILGSILAFVGINAAIGGFLLILDPTGSKIGLTPEILLKSPFSTFFIPGIILCAINGVGSLAASVLAFRKNKHTGFAGAAFGSILCGWILVQMLWIDFFWIQPAFLLIGCIEIALSLAIIRIIRQQKNV